MSDTKGGRRATNFIYTTFRRFFQGPLTENWHQRQSASKYIRAKIIWGNKAIYLRRELSRVLQIGTAWNGSSCSEVRFWSFWTKSLQGYSNLSTTESRVQIVNVFLLPSHDFWSTVSITSTATNNGDSHPKFEHLCQRVCRNICV